MSINGLDDKQILTFMQLTSGKTYTFVGTTGNYSDYMCVTAGMFEAPKKDFSSYEIKITLNFTSNSTFNVSLPGNQEYSGDKDNSYLVPAADLNGSLEKLSEWSTYFKNNSNYLFSFTDSEECAFIPKYMLQYDTYIFSFTNRFDNTGAPIIYSDGIQQSVGQEASLRLGQNPTIVDSYEKQQTNTTEDASFIFHYPLYINQGGTSFWNDGTILSGLDGGSFNYLRDIEFLFSIRIGGFYRDPQVYNGYASFSHTSTYSETETTITRNLNIYINDFWFRTV